MQLGVRNVFSDDIAIDLGTANTLVHVLGRGVIIDEPSAVALQTRGGEREFLAVGRAATEMRGRKAEHIEVMRPLREGVIADFVATEHMLREFIKRTKRMAGFRKPRILICVPAGSTPVERRAVYESAVSAGARRVLMIEEPVAASIGAELPINEPRGFMVIDMGGGTTDIAVLANGGVVQARSLRCAGNAMNEAIVRYIRRNEKLLIGEVSAERIKIEAGSAVADPNARGAEIHIKGRDVDSGEPKSVILHPDDIAEALSDTIEDIADYIHRALEDLPPELSTAVCADGIHLTGGGAMLHGLDKELERRIGINFIMPEEPMLCVVRGSAEVLREMKAHQHLLIRA